MAVKKTSQVERKTAGRPKKTAAAAPAEKPAATRKNNSVEDEVTERIEKEISELTGRVEETGTAPETPVDVERIAEAIRGVDTSIKEDDGLREVSEEIKEALRPVQELTERVSAINMTQEAIDKAVAQSPEKAEELIRNELSRAAALKDEIAKMMNAGAVSGETGKSTTRWWNGMSIL